MAEPTLNQLRAFLAILRTGSFRGAAAQLHLSQPSVSQRMRELEAGLGAILFIRKGPQIVLTAEGHALTGYAERILEISGEMAGRFRTGDPLRGTLRIGLSETFALVCLGDLLQRVEKKYPAVKASMVIGDSGELSRKLEDRLLDIGIVAEAEVPEYVAQEPAGSSQLGWFAAPSLRSHSPVSSPAEIAQHHLVIGPPSSRMHQTIGRWFAADDVVPQRVSTCNNVTVTLQAVRAGAVVGLLPVRVAQADLDKGRVRQLRVAPAIPAHNISICYQASEAGEGLLAFVSVLKKVIADHHVYTALSM